MKGFPAECFQEMKSNWELLTGRGKQLSTKLGGNHLKKTVVSYNQEVQRMQFSAVLRSSCPLYAQTVFQEMV